MEKKWIRSMACVGIGMVLFAVLPVIAPPKTQLEGDHILVREGYGGDEKKVELQVDGLKEETVPLTIAVSPRTYTEQEAVSMCSEVREKIESVIKGDNSSLQEVRTDLKLPSGLDGYAVELGWRSSDSSVLSSSGRVKLEGGNAQEITLYLTMTVGEYKEEHLIPITVLPHRYTAEEIHLTRFQNLLKRADKKQSANPELVLPTEYGKRSISYREQVDNPYRVLPLWGVVLAVVFLIKDESDKKEVQKRREQELLLDYSEVVSKLMVLIGAGMTVRNAWERMVKDYELARGQGRKKERAAYEEMRITYHQVANGISEGIAYREFGNRCKLQSYLKLSSLLEQNRKTGTKNLRAMLQTEVEDAFEQRKNLARRMGEEAGTKLLVPLFLLLGISMVMIMVPAMLAMK